MTEEIEDDDTVEIPVVRAPAPAPAPVRTRVPAPEPPPIFPDGTFGCIMIILVLAAAFWFAVDWI